MARMIPSSFSLDVKSTGEKRIFNWFKNAKGTEDWVVLHSLGIENHISVIHGECDFVVLVPHMGIYVLEVKAGGVKRTGKGWYFENKKGEVSKPKERGPWDQAWEGAFSLIQFIIDNLDSRHSYLSNVFYGIGVMFPDIHFIAEGPDQKQWQIFDEQDDGDVYNYILRLAENSKLHASKIFKENIDSKEFLSIDDVNYLADLLRPNFEYTVSLSNQISETEHSIIHFTKEQYLCLDNIDENPRCLIKGAAGTGKTLIAIQAAKRAKADGKKVGFFCFNKTLASWLEKEFTLPKNSLYQPEFIGTFHSYLIKLANELGLKSYPDDKQAGLFFQKTLPQLILQNIKLLNPEFDVVIVDEAQDIISEDYLNIIDHILHGSLKRGRWLFFGDFVDQAIYTSYTDCEMLDLLDEHSVFLIYKLTENCRNTSQICEQVQSFSEIKPLWKKENGIAGQPVAYYKYNDYEDEKSKLISIIDNLRKENVPEGSITILSPEAKEHSIVNKLSGVKILNYSVRQSSYITFSTIQSFKGLENSVIILTDINSYMDKKLVYVAMSRARSKLFVLESENAWKERVKITFGI